jgi:hypothetical protein
MATNQVYLDENNIIHATFEGDQTTETVNPTISQAVALSRQLAGINKPTLILVDQTKLGKTTTSSRGAFVKVIKNNLTPKDRIAILGKGIISSSLVNFISIVSGKDKSIHYFDQATYDIADALNFLNTK